MSDAEAHVSGAVKHEDADDDDDDSVNEDSAHEDVQGGTAIVKLPGVDKVNLSWQ